MRRAIDLAIKAVVAFVFVVCVECFCLRLRGKARGERPAPLPPARLRMRTGTGRAPHVVVFRALSLEGLCVPGVACMSWAPKLTR